jgi:hypothetical protein
MALTMPPTGLGSGIDKDRQDYTVYTGGWDIGRIYKVRGGPDSLHWFWSLTVNGPMTRSAQLCGQPRRWITSAGLSPVALAPMGAQQMPPNITPTVFHRHELFCSDFPLPQADTFNGGRSMVDRSMTKAEHFREYAEEAMQWSRQSI